MFELDRHFIPEPIIRELLLPNAVRVVERCAGGLSGARVWRAAGLLGPVALRCWPTEHPTPERLSQIHTAMHLARQAGMRSVPSLICNARGHSYTRDGNRLWELTEWMPGVADYVQAPSTPRLGAALRELALLHRVWGGAASGPEQLSPTVVERCSRLQHWLQRLPELGLPEQGRQALAASPELGRLSGDTLRQLALRGPSLLVDLERLRTEPVLLHFVLRDIWSDHVLFTGAEVTGIIDFGAGRLDEPATDVARLLGTMEPFDNRRWQLGWESYHEVQPHVELRRVLLLDRVGTLLSALQWLQWLVLEGRSFQVPREGLVGRWQRIVARLEAE
jgi:Ser/Thr protein kinase RdoA (MazF antagonist)